MNLFQPIKSLDYEIRAATLLAELHMQRTLVPSKKNQYVNLKNM